MLGHKKLIESFLDDELSVLNEKMRKNKQENRKNVWALVL